MRPPRLSRRASAPEGKKKAILSLSKHFTLGDLRIKFYAKWKKFIKEQAVDPDHQGIYTFPISNFGSGWSGLGILCKIRQNIVYPSTGLE
jgi:hypothetical protein